MTTAGSIEGRRDRMLTARDQVQRRDDNTIEILSHLPKDHWTAYVTGIEIDGDAYILTERDIVETQHGPRHRFLLEIPEHDVLFRSFLRYQPEEVRDVYRAQQRLNTAMWVETFPFVWGLLDQELQQRLGAIYNYDPFKWTRWTAVGVGLFAGGAAWRNGQTMLAGGATAVNGLAFFTGLFLVLEALNRWSQLNKKAIKGSLLGLPFRALAVRALRWE